MSGKDRTKTTNYESRTSTYSADSGGGGGGGRTSDSAEYVYRPMMGPRNIIIQRSSYGGLGTGMGGGGMNSRSYSMERSVNYGGGFGGLPAGSYSVVTTTGMNSVKESRDREKKDMQDLNERFANYIEKVRFLEAQNRKLSDELEKLKAGWGKETTAIKAMYEAELDEARKLLDDGQKDKARLEIKLTSVEDLLEEARRNGEDLRRSCQEERDKVEKQNQQLSDYESEISLLRRRLDNLETDRDKDKKQIAQLTESLNRARLDLDNETLLHIDAENRRQTLEEQMEFMKAVHDQEMKELAALVYRDTTSENRQFWKNEMGQALREIQQVYDDKLDVMRGELETFYNMKVQEFRSGAAREKLDTSHTKELTSKLRTQMTDFQDRNLDLENRNAQLIRELEFLRREKDDREREMDLENGELKNELIKLRAEMEAVLREVQNLMDTKLGLELEISAYRKLLECEESRVMSGFSGSRSVDGEGGGGGRGGGGSGGRSESGGSSARGASRSGGTTEPRITSRTESRLRSSGPGEDEDEPESFMKRGEMSAKTSFQRSAKGPVSISECGTDGKYISLENTGRKDENLSGWLLKRIVDDRLAAEFTLPEGLILERGTRIKIWAKGSKPDGAPAADIESTEKNWGVGANISTKLLNPALEERATHTQKTIYT